MVPPLTAGQHWQLEIDTARVSIEVLSAKVGTVLLILGVMHFFNLYVFSRMRRRSMLLDALPPVSPDACAS